MLKMVMFERRLPKELRAREASLAPWTDTGIASERVRAVLHILADAFRWSHADALRLRPEDKVWPLYRAYYPQEHWWQRWAPDELEMETLLRDLQKQAPAGIVIDLHPDITVGELARLVAS